VSKWYSPLATMREIAGSKAKKTPLSGARRLNDASYRRNTDDVHRASRLFSCQLLEIWSGVG